MVLQGRNELHVRRKDAWLDNDRIVAPYSKREVVESQSPEIAAHPNWVPVVEKGSADQRLAKAQFGNVVTTDDDVRKYLKAIHKTLKANGD